MHKVHREGVDVNLAFLVASKRLRSANSQVKASNKDAVEQRNIINIPASEVEALEVSGFSAKKYLKKLARSFAGVIYRVLRPFIRPILYRIRAYFTEGLRQELIREMRASSSASTREIQSSVVALRHDMAKLLEISRQEVLKASAASVQEAQATREMLRREVEGLLTRLNWEQGNNLVDRLEKIEAYSQSAARRIAVNGGHGEILIKTEVGFVICSATDHALVAALIDAGEQEPGTRILIQNFLKPGDTYVDVGANIGMHVLAAARAMQGQGQIIAFEPFEPTQQMLEKTIWMNGYSAIVEVHQAAVFNAKGTQSLHLGATSGHHSLYEQDVPKQFSQPSVEVPLVRLDGVLPIDRRIDLLKIDAEGAELEVIEGGELLIANNDDIALIVEFGPSHLSRASHELDQWLRVFDRLGLTYRAINPYSGALEVVSCEQLEQVASVNLFLAREGSKAWGRLRT